MADDLLSDEQNKTRALCNLQDPINEDEFVLFLYTATTIPTVTISYDKSKHTVEQFSYFSPDVITIENKRYI